MDRQFLKGLDLESETIDKILDDHHSSVNDLKEQLSTKKDEVKEVKKERDDFKSKAEENQDAQDKINSLQSKYDEAKDQVEKYKKQIENSDLDKQIIQNVSDAYDVDDVLNFIDKDSFERDDDGNITNFEDVLKSVREKKPHYFNTQQGAGDDDNNTNPNGEGQGTDEGTGTEGKGATYQTGKGQGAGSTGKSDLVSLGEQWAERLGGKSNG